MKHRFRDIISILSPAERKNFYALVLLDLLVSILEIGFLVALLYVIGFYTGTYQSESLFFLPTDYFEKNPLTLISVFFILFSLKNMLAYLVSRLQFRFVYKVASRISEQSLEQYLQADYHEFVTVDSSVQIRRISQQPIEFSHHVLRGVQLIWSNIILLILTIVPIFLFSNSLFLLLVLVLIPPVFLTILFTKRKLALIRAGGKLNREKSLQHLQEALSGFIEINIDSRHEFFIDRYARFQEKFNDSLAEQQIVQSLPSKLMEVFAVFGLFVLVTATTVLGLNNSLHVLLIGGFMAAAYKIIPGVVKILNAREQIKTYGYTVDDLLKHPFVREDAASPANTPLNSIQCRGITFQYKSKTVLHEFSMELKQGDFVGVSGYSGAGKSTLLNILLGLLPEQTGEVYMNGTLTTPPSRRTFWNRISYARQQSFFIHDTIGQNILLGSKRVAEKLNQILAITGVDAIAAQYPEGLNLLLSENGKNISGGQRQRVIMARSLYKDADLYLFDEPFNELDQESAMHILTQLKAMANAGKMIVLVTHDQEMLSNCDKIFSVHEK